MNEGVGLPDLEELELEIGMTILNITTRQSDTKVK